VAGNAVNEAARQASVGATDSAIHATVSHAMGGFNFTSQASVNHAAQTVTVRVGVPKLYAWIPDGLDTVTVSTSYIPED
jgi:hypothetical protein